MTLISMLTLDAANQFLTGYLPIYNQRVSVQPAQPADLHRPRPTRRELDRSLCMKTIRCLRRDWTVAHHGQLYQVRTNVRAPHILVEERVDGTMRMTHNGQPLNYHAIPARPKRVAAPPKAQVHRRPVKPTSAHPWRKRLLQEGTKHAAAAIA